MIEYISDFNGIPMFKNTDFNGCACITYVPEFKMPAIIVNPGFLRYSKEWKSSILWHEYAHFKFNHIGKKCNIANELVADFYANVQTKNFALADFFNKLLKFYKCKHIPINKAVLVRFIICIITTPLYLIIPSF